MGGGSYRNQIAAFVVAFFCAVSTFCTANVAEAGADIYFEFSNVSTHPGGIKITGYFYNRGSTGATVTKMHFIGNVDGCNINCIFNNPDVGWIAGYSSKIFSFTINDNFYKYHKNNPPWKLNYAVSFK